MSLRTITRWPTFSLIVSTEYKYPTSINRSFNLIVCFGVFSLLRFWTKLLFYNKIILMFLFAHIVIKTHRSFHVFWVTNSICILWSDEVSDISMDFGKICSKSVFNEIVFRWLRLSFVIVWLTKSSFKTIDARIIKPKHKTFQNFFGYFSAKYETFQDFKNSLQLNFVCINYLILIFKTGKCSTQTHLRVSYCACTCVTPFVLGKISKIQYSQSAQQQ